MGWGRELHEDYTTDEPGSLLSVNLHTKAIDVVADKLGKLDGITRVGGEVIVNDWISGELFGVADDGTVRTIGTWPAGLADISAHGDTLFLPSMLEGTLSAQTMR